MRDPPRQERDWTFPDGPLGWLLFITFDLLLCAVLSFLGSVSPPVPRSPWLSLLAGATVFALVALGVVIGPFKPAVRTRGYRVFAGIVYAILFADALVILWLFWRFVTA